MESREQRIMTLATTLKSSGIAKTDSQARMMAEDMIGVEEHVQESFEEEHTKANEYLRTVKNLGAPRQASQSIQASKIEQLSVSQKESIKGYNKEPTEYVKPILSKKSSGDDYTDAIFGTKTLNQANTEAQDHDTHNPAIEAMKEQLKNTKLIPLEDMQQKDVVSEDISDVSSEDLSPESLSQNLDVDSSDVLEPPQKVSPIEEIDDAVKHAVEEIATGDTAVETSTKDESLEDEKLDTQKLVEMMEEDGKLEEHTRQITEKPKDVKPKEAYPENDIDLGNVFNFTKR